MSIHDATRVRERARALGFDAVAIARADVPLDEEMRRYAAFLEDGMHGQMRYLGEHVEVRRRLDTADVLPGARSVVCLARRYPGSLPPVGEDGDRSVLPRVAGYARGRDYHNFLRKKLRRLAAFVRTIPGPDGGPSAARPLCDDAPVLERAWAARAGLGFVGKNGLLIVPGQGSFVLLGEVVTTLPLEPDAPIAGRCGACTACLDACPTGAFPRPFVLDARRCVAYLTIELRGAIPEASREGVGAHLFGCDDCQTVCPFNGGAAQRVSAWDGPFAPAEGLRATSLVDLLSPGGVGAASPPGSPLLRAGAEGLARNAAVVLGNLRAREAKDALERAAETHPSEHVREAARWAVRRLERLAGP